VEFEQLPEATLKKYIKKKIELSDKNCGKLIEICEHDYSRILLEIDKIKTFREYPHHTDLFAESKMSEDASFTELLKQGVIYQPSKDAIFDFVDAILKRQSKRTFNLLKQCYDVGESTIVLLSVLYTNVKQVLQVQSCESSDISKSTGLTAWQIKCAKEKAGRYEIWELVDALRLIRDVEKGIKTGQIEDNIAIQYVLVNML
jgi:hypothetical protein